MVLIRLAYLVVFSIHDFTMPCTFGISPRSSAAGCRTLQGDTSSSLGREETLGKLKLLYPKTQKSTKKVLVINKPLEFLN